MADVNTNMYVAINQFYGYTEPKDLDTVLTRLMRDVQQGVVVYSGLNPMDATATLLRIIEDSKDQVITPG